MQPLPLLPEAQRLVAQLKSVEAVQPETGPMYHAMGMGAGFYLAYEQLRNVATYREHHLLLRSAIERFLTRAIKWPRVGSVAEELVAELTQSGYLKNDTVPLAKLAHIDALLARYGQVYVGLTTDHNVKRPAVGAWLYQIASCQIEDLLVPNRRLAIFVAFAYEHYLRTVDLPVPDPEEDALAIPIALYCAVQRTLFKADMATTRYYCLAARLASLAPAEYGSFVQTNILLDELYQAPRTSRLVRLINRYGAPVRILREVVVDSGAPAEALTDRDGTLTRVKRAAQQQYQAVRQRLRGQIIKAILFILVTKTLLGVAVEVPYDIFLHGTIAWVPLSLNIVFPVAYMAAIAWSITTPGQHNTELVADHVDRILYDGAGGPVHYRLRTRVTSVSLRRAFNAIYTIGFIKLHSLPSVVLKANVGIKS